ncbi:MAG: response regulator transcription factor [Kofleriaceae bacterium]
MRLLLVEDEERLAAAIAGGLAAEGFAVDAVRNGAEGLRRAIEGQYAAIVLDILLPGMNGYEICAALRGRQMWVPILMLTAKDGEHDEAKALDLGADDFLSKPFSYVVLVARLRALVRRGSGARPVVLCVDDLELDPVTRRCRRAGHDIALTPRECALLAALMRCCGDVLSKQRILDEVWGLDFQGAPNVVEVYIGYLRRKIDTPFGRASLETLRGVGYRLTADHDHPEGPR